MPLLRWVHSSSAGVEHLLCPEIVDNPNITLTNAKGVFSRYEIFYYYYYYNSSNYVYL